jgi:DNA-binding CsgD family transcriptional regulator
MPPRDRHSAVRAPHRDLVERDGELVRIGQWIETGASGVGQLVVVLGPAGIGKTCLLDAVRDQTNRDGVRVLGAVAGELETGVTFAVVHRLFETAVASASGEERANLLAGAARFAAPVVDPTAVPRWERAGDVGAVLHGLYWLVANMAEHTPIVLVVDDAHWVDAASGAWLVYLARRLQDLAVSLVVGVRTGEPSATWLSALMGLREAHRVELGPLSAAGTAQLASSILGGARVDDEICAACHRATGGNPFLVAELVRALSAEGSAPNAIRVGALSPETVSRSIALRLARMQPAAGHLARAFAVLGSDAQLRHAAAVAGLEAPFAAEAADELVAAGILESTELGFVHPILRTSVYKELPPAWRAMAHGTAARVLAAEGAAPAAIAAHLLRAETVGDPATVEVLRFAAAEAIDAGTPGTAVELLRRALAEPPTTTMRGAVLYELGRAELTARQGGGIEHLAEALRASRDGPERARLALALAQAEVGEGRLVSAEKLLNQATSESGDEELVARIETYRCALGSWLPQFAPATESRLAELRTLAGGDGPGAHGLLLVLAFRAVFRGEPSEEIIALVERGLSGVDIRAGQQTDPVFWAVRSLTFLDELDRADEVLAVMFAHARATGSPSAFAAASECRAAVSLRRGNIDAAEEDARRALDLVVAHQLGFLAPQVHAFLAEALLERGEVDQAVELLEGADLAAMRGSRPESLFLHTRGRARIARGLVARGLADLRQCQSIQESLGFANPNVLAWRSTLALALPGVARDEARSLAELELQQARALGQPRAIGVALRSQALLAGRDRSISLLRDAVRALEQSPSRLEHARALTDLGAALRRANQRAAAREPLGQALDLASRCGASALAGRARDELVATGARPRRMMRVGPDALTPTENRVAAMAAGGRSNREIAEALFVSMKTVATHLGSAYQKLEINTREQLSSALARPTDPPMRMNG